MAHKMNITQETEDALRKANVPEEGIAKLRETEVDDVDVEKLDLDSLDGIAGGGIYGIKVWAPDDWRCSPYDNMTWIEGATFIKGMCDSFGEDVAIDICNKRYCKSVDWADYIHGYGPEYAAYYMWSMADSVWHG